MLECECLCHLGLPDKQKDRWTPLGHAGKLKFIRLYKASSLNKLKRHTAPSQKDLPHLISGSPSDENNLFKGFVQLEYSQSPYSEVFSENT